MTDVCKHCGDTVEYTSGYFIPMTEMHGRLIARKPLWIGCSRGYVLCKECFNKRETDLEEYDMKFFKLDKED